MLDDNEKHELRMAIGNGTMQLSDALSADDTLEAMAEVVDAGERFTNVLKAHGLPLHAIIAMAQGAAAQRLINRLGADD